MAQPLVTPSTSAATPARSSAPTAQERLIASTPVEVVRANETACPAATTPEGNKAGAMLDEPVPPTIEYPAAPAQATTGPEARPAEQVVAAPGAPPSPAPAPQPTPRQEPAIAIVSAAAAVAAPTDDARAAAVHEDSVLTTLVIRLDTWMYGRRRVLLIGTLSFFLAAPVIDTWLEAQGALVTTSWILFLVVTFVLVGARVLSLRDESGHWRLDVVIRRGQQAFNQDDEDDATSERKTTSPAERKRAISTWLVVGGLVVLTVEKLWAWLDAPAPDVLMWVGGGALGIGFLVWLRSREELCGAGRAKDLVLDRGDQAQMTSLADAVRALPARLDVRDGNFATMAQGARHPLLRAFLLTIVNWPSKRYDFEGEYQDALVRRLRRRCPEAEPRPECNVDLGRIDIMLGNALAVELKLRLDSSGVDRAVGQIRKYLMSPRPLVIVICGRGHEQARLLFDTIDAERTRGQPVAVIVARN